MNLPPPPRTKETLFRVTIDDLGLFPESEESVLELSGRGVPLYASWLTNFLPPTPDYLRKQKNVHNGLHFNVLEGRGMLRKSSLVNDRGLFHKKWWDFLIPTPQLRRDVEMEMEAQIIHATNWFGHLSHFDSHLHLHAIPWIYDIAKRMAKRFNIPHVRNSVEAWSDSRTFQPKTLLLEGLQKIRKQPEMPCYGISVTFNLDAKKCLEFVRTKQSREFVFHTCVRVPLQIPETSTYVTPVDMEKRFGEHLQLSLFLDLLKRET